MKLVLTNLAESVDDFSRALGKVTTDIQSVISDRGEVADTFHDGICGVEFILGDAFSRAVSHSLRFMKQVALGSITSKMMLTSKDGGTFHALLEVVKNCDRTIAQFRFLPTTKEQTNPVKEETLKLIEYLHTIIKAILACWKYFRDSIKLSIKTPFLDSNNCWSDCPQKLQKGADKCNGRAALLNASHAKRFQNNANGKDNAIEVPATDYLHYQSFFDMEESERPVECGTFYVAARKLGMH